MLCEPNANILVYTEYADSLHKVQERLKSEKLGTVLTLQGSDDEAARKNTTSLFRSHDRVLLLALGGVARLEEALGEGR